MHAYYQKKSAKLKRTVKNFLALVGSVIEVAGGKPYEAAFEKIWSICERDMLEHFPYIGDDEASGGECCDYFITGNKE